ncbi:MAG: hypothetical protein IH624_13425 [Phycisphaerae bacterium]|nr:hypothetical protein [Phycisphaerae bacterium]
MDTIWEHLALTGLAVGVGLTIGGSWLLYGRWRDKRNAAAAGPEELKYIELSQQQKRDGWTFAQRYDFLKQVGFRRNNIDEIMGKAERFVQTEVTTEQFDAACDEVLGTTDNAVRDAFLLRTYAGFRDGRLAHLPTIYSMQEGRAAGVQQFVNLYRNVYGEAITFCASQRPFDADEILAVVDAASFLLTNKALYLFGEKGGYVPMAVLLLKDIAEYSVRGWWTCRVEVHLRDGQACVFGPLSSTPREEVVRGLIAAQ